MVKSNITRSIYIENPSHAMGHLQEKIRGLGVVFASCLRLIDEFPPGVELASVFKIAPYAQHFTPDGLDIRLGAVEAGSPLALLFEFHVKIQDSGDMFRLPIRFVTDVPSRQIKEHSINIEFAIPIVYALDPIDPPEDVVDAVRVLNLYRMNERIWRDIEEGDIPLATKRLHQFSTRLLEAGHAELAQQVEMETERLKIMGAYSETIRKRLKFGTRALISQTINTNT
jgi:Ca-activated chloride channel family protein